MLKNSTTTSYHTVLCGVFFLVLNKPKKRRHKSGDGEDASDAEEDAAASDGEEDAAETSEATEERAPSPKRARKEASPPAAEEASGDAPVEVSQPRLEEFMTELFAVFEKDRSQVLSMDKVRSEIVGGTKGFTAAELLVCIEKMTEMNKVMMASNELYLI